MNNLILISGTASLVALSRRSFRHWQSHGFFRFFAFEAILCLLVLNAPRWFTRPLAFRQLCSWALLSASLFLAIHGFRLLHRLGQPTLPAPGSTNYRIENTSMLVTSGAYRYIRHPLYASALLGAWGTALKTASMLSIALGLTATAFLLATAKAEERENLARFGAAYRAYMGRTRRFIPRLWGGLADPK